MKLKNRAKVGSLVFVGTGILMGGHISARALKFIQKADIVFSAPSDGISEKWIETLNNNVNCLQKHYKEGLSRGETYKYMVEEILNEVRKGKNVVGAFYGHPGVFAYVSHKSISEAKKEGFYTHMEPGISAEDCLYADLGIDPGKYGCQQYEATQFIAYKRVWDVTSYLILWQIGVVGDLSLKRTKPRKEFLRFLVDYLTKFYDPGHQVIVYEAQTLPINGVRVEKIELRNLVEVELFDYSTLVIPPAKSMQVDQEHVEILEKIAVS